MFIKKQITLLDTSACTENLGDQIIVEAILNEFEELKNAKSLCTHNFWSLSESRQARQTQIAVLTGTNALSSSVFPPTPWRLGPLEILSLRKKVVIVGAGWRKYESVVTPLQNFVYRWILSPKIPVAVRDRYSEKKLSQAGINVLYTGCPTMWSLGSETVELSNHKQVVLTLTDYSRSPMEDQFLIDTLAEQFELVKFWPQGSGDLDYIMSLRLPPNIRILPRNLEALNDALLFSAYIGTRLHAGIRAAQLNSPSLVIGVDNRATEIGHDTNFPVVDRARIFVELVDAIEALKQKREIVLPITEINKFKSILNILIGD